MNPKTEIKQARHPGLWGALLTISLGLIFLMTPSLEETFNHWSFDLPTNYRPDRVATNVVVVYMDQKSHDELGQPPLQEWHRTLHAELIGRLESLGARAIVFDVLMDQPWTNKVLSPVALNVLTNRLRFELDQVTGPNVDATLARRVREAACPTVFAADIVDMTLVTPERVLGNPALYGQVGFPAKAREPVRQHCRTEDPPGLAWVAANLFDRAPPEPSRSRWINYYGPRKTMPHQSYVNVLFNEEIPLGFFSNKVVFVGKERVNTPASTDLRDEYPTPYTHWSGHGRGDLTPGVDLHATAFVNFYNHDWLLRLSAPTLLLLFILTGGAFGFGLSAVRPWIGLRFALLGTLLVTCFAVWLMWSKNYWFPWAIIVAVQIPTALGWSVLVTTRRLYREKADLEKSLATALTHAGGEQVTATEAPTTIGGPVPIQQGQLPPRVPHALDPEIPDHTLLKCVGKGAYGEVWLARDIIGSYHAVKIVYRHSFSSDSPYQREFSGLQKFTPISRLHPGLVQILHVGRHESNGYFYSIMEVGDDAQTGQEIQPEAYAPRNLARELDTRGRWPAAEALELGLALSDALEFLHQRKLIHRDIKPSNIIFVRDQPKFADIGLVTEIATTGRDVSYLGTEGFIAPEGPGSAAADVYSLGKLLYEVCMGRDRHQFPELPTQLEDWPDRDLLLRLNPIICQACENQPSRRYASASALHADLRQLQEEWAGSSGRSGSH